MRDRNTWLNATIIELADIGDEEADEAEHARMFTARLAELLFPAEVFVLIPATRTEPEVAAGGSELAVRLARLEGPELMAAAAASGIRVHFTLPMRRHGETLGTVSVLSAHDQAPAAADILLARALTEVAAISILQRRALRRSHQATRQLQHALDSRVIIEQGKGAVAAWLGITPDEAFEMLRTYARSHSARLAQVARDVLGGQIPAAALGSSVPGRKAGETSKTSKTSKTGETSITS